MRTYFENIHPGIAAFFKNKEEKYVEFPMDYPLEKRINYICEVLNPWLTGVRLNFNFAVARTAELIPLSSVKIFIYKLLGVNIGKGVFISPDVILDPHFPKLITLEDYTVLGWGSKIFVHEMSTEKYRIGRVTIKKGAVIGAFSVIRAGVTIGEMAQTCMNSFVYKDVPAHHSVKFDGIRYE
jgi:acetyltransferase-like isoleucine patch superfamily enzyme